VTANEQQKLFVDEYLKLRKKNQTQAAINAGYSPKTAASQSSQLLKNPKVIKYLEEREKLLESELRQEFMFDALEARKVMYEILKNPESADKDRLAAAKDLLDRAGFKPTENTNVNLTTNQKLEDFFK
jgi:phage terminase small subunit